MNLSACVGTFVVFLSCVAGARLGAEVPTSSSPPQTTPTPAPSVAEITPPAAAAAPIDPAKEAEIRKLLDVTGTVKVVNQMLKQLMGQLRERYPDLPPEFVDHLQKEMNPDKLVEKLIPVYDKYYSLDDLKAVGAFYQSTAGQHLLQVQGQVVKESQAIGQQWGREAGMKAVLEIQDYKQKMSTTAPSTNNVPEPASSSTPSKP
jgi:hypothetical protein